MTERTFGVTQINERRVELLTKRASGGLSEKEEAELYLMTELMRQLTPAVTDEDKETLERIGEELQRLNEVNP